MVRYARWALLPVVLAWSTGAGSALAQKAGPPRTVQDDAGMFSTQAKEKANRDVAEIKTRFRKDLLIETRATAPKLPETIDSKNAKAIDEFYDKWAKQLFDNDAVDGVFVIITQKPARVQIQLGNETRRLGEFTTEDRSELRKIFMANLKKDPDGALTSATSFALSVFTKHRRSGAQSPAPGPRDGGRPAPAPEPEQEGVPWVKYILIGLAILIVVWLVMGVIRALSGAGRAPGYGGGPGGGGYGGGGGGGFFSSLLGGLFGAAAGMWLYNNMFGGHTSSAHAGEPGGYGGGSTEPTDVGAGSTGEGGDWGGGGGGGDW